MNALVPIHANDYVPESIEAEQVVLGSLLRDNEAFYTVNAILDASYFHNEIHKHIYEIAHSLILSGKTADAITLKNRLSQDGALNDIGGESYISSLLMAGGSISVASAMAELVREMYQRRQVLARTSDLQACMLDIENEGVPAIVSDAIGDIDLLVHEKNAGINRSQSSAELVDHFIAGLDNDTDNRKCDTGFYEIDKALGGLHGERVYILAGRPSMGKSTVALNIIRNVAMSGVGVLFLSLEMGNSDQTPRMFGSIGAKVFGPANFPEVNNLRREWKGGNREQIDRVREIYAQLPVEWEQGFGMSVKNIRMTVNRAVRSMRKRGIKLGLIVIDHIGHIKGSNARSSMYERTSEVSNELIPLSKKYDVPVLALCQLSRKCEERDDKRPRLDDLRESGHIEQDAAVVISVYRDYYYAEREARAKQGEDQDLSNRLIAGKNLVELNILKNRFGQVRNVDLFTDLSRMFIDNMAQDYRGQTQ